MTDHEWKKLFLKAHRPGSHLTIVYYTKHSSVHLKQLQTVLNVGGIASNPESINAIKEGISGEYIFNIEDRYYTFFLTDRNPREVGRGGGIDSNGRKYRTTIELTSEGISSRKEYID